METRTGTGMTSTLERPGGPAVSGPAMHGHHEPLSAHTSWGSSVADQTIEELRNWLDGLPARRLRRR